MGRFNIKYILALFIFSMFSAPVIADANYDAGIKAYNKGKYDFAEILFKKSIADNYIDVNSRYMYAQVLLKQQKYEQAKKEYNQIIKMSPYSQAAHLSKKGLNLIDKLQSKQEVENKKQDENTNSPQKNNVRLTTGNTLKLSLSNSGDDYLNEAYVNGTLMTHPRGNVVVYIPEDTPQKYKTMAMEAFYSWQSVMSGVRFVFVFDPVKAGNKIIEVRFPRENGNSDAQSGFTGAYSFISVARVTIFVGPDGQALSDDMIRYYLLHEVGHAIGIKGHSPNSDDVMSSLKTTPILQLSQRDKNTAKALYHMNTQISSNEQMKKNEYDFKQKNEKEGNGLLELGNKYYTSGDYDSAIEQYLKAEKVYPRASKGIYLRLAGAYKATGNVSNQLRYLKKAFEMDKSDSETIKEMVALYKSQNRTQDIQNLYDDVIKFHPDKRGEYAQYFK